MRGRVPFVRIQRPIAQWPQRNTTRSNEHSSDLEGWGGWNLQPGRCVEGRIEQLDTLVGNLYDPVAVRQFRPWRKDHRFIAKCGIDDQGASRIAHPPRKLQIQCRCRRRWGWRQFLWRLQGFR